MSFAVDVNILLVASNRGDPLQAKAEAFLAECAHGREVFCLAWPTLMGYLRISTHASIFAQPLTPAEALSNVESLVACPMRAPSGGNDGFLRAYREVGQQVPARGNLVPDAHREFRKFGFLDVVDPLV